MPATKRPRKVKQEKVKNPRSITFYYIKGTQHHVAHIDGAIGSITPQGFVVASLYSERFAIPQETTHSLIDGTLAKGGQPEDVKGKKGVVREIDITAVLTAESAKLIGEWLIARGKEVEVRMERAKAARKGGK